MKKVSSMTKYEVVLEDPHHDVIGRYLSCHSTVPRDKRDVNSAFVHVNEISYGELWSFEPVKDKLCTYKIKLASQPAHFRDVGKYLGAHRAYRKDIRDANSTFVHSHKTYYGDEWTLIPVPSKGENAFRIMLSKPLDKPINHPVGKMLCAHRVYGKDKRTVSSTYVDVHGTSEDTGHYWKLIPMPASKL